MRLYLLLCISTLSLFSNDYMPDDMSVSDGLTILFHNSPQYNWLYGQQSGPKVSNIGQAVREQWKAGMRGAKVNLHWRAPITLEEQLRREIGHAAKTKQVSEKRIKAFDRLIQSKLGKPIFKKVKEFVRVPDEITSSEPYIALCHEGDGKRNCFLSLFQKPGVPDRAEEYFRAIAQLLKEHPRDIVIILLEDYLHRVSPLNGMDKYTKEQRKKMLEELLVRSGLASYAFKLGPQYYPQGDTPAKKLPTYGQMRKSGKRALIFTDDGFNAQGSAYLNSDKGIFRYSHWAFDWEADLGKACRLYRSQEAPSFVISVGPETSIKQGSLVAKGLRIAKTLGIDVPKVGGKRITGANYRDINSIAKLRQRTRDCEQASPGGYVTALSLDFGNKGQAQKAARLINQERIKEHERIKKEDQEKKGAE